MTGLDAVKAATWPLHKQAERSGVIADILAGRASRTAVALLLRNLLAVYETLDCSAAGHPALARSSFLSAGYRLLASGREPSVLAPATAYAERIRSSGHPALLAHAYVRYLGDLNGGLIIRRRLIACLGAEAEKLELHAYPGIADLEAFRRDYRARLDEAVRGAGTDAVAEEAKIAFRMSIELSEAVRTAASATDVPPIDGRAPPGRDKDRGLPRSG